MKNTKNKAKTNLPTGENPSGSFPIVGVGASAGGLEAFQKLLRALPAKANMAFVLIQHLDPKHQSALTSILSKSTSMPVLEVKDGMKVEASHVYIIPPNFDLFLSDGHLKLSPRSRSQGQHLPVNSFLVSLANEMLENALGVILSGTGSDGSLGIQSIKSGGGITFAQDEESATYDQMPKSAIATGCVDFVLAPTEIAKELARISQHPYLMSQEQASPQDELENTEVEEFGKILFLLRKHFKVDFANYKEATIKRRILKRMVQNKLDAIGAYRRLLEVNATEVDALYNDILINVTSFFRDTEPFQVLKDEIFPAIMKGRKNEPVRIWVPGCSTGEEVYSIAISLLEFLGDKAATTIIQIFATDISERAIEKARKGIYSENGVDGVSQDRLLRFFTKQIEGYQISKSIREMCVFATQNVTADPPFSRVDLISCRNLLIYLGPALQKKVMPIFHYALKDTGILLLGTSETIGVFSHLFQQIDGKNKIYSKKLTAMRSRFELPNSYSPRDFPSVPQIIKNISAAPKVDIKRDFERYLLNHYVPVGVFVNKDLEIIHTMGDIGPYLTLSQGAPSLNVAKMAHEGLAVDLRTLIQKAKKVETPIKSEPLRIKYNGGYKNVCIEVVSLKGPELGGQNLLILFREVTTELQKPSKGSGSRLKSGKKISAGTMESKNFELQRELAVAKKSLQSLKDNFESSLEAQEAVNEKLKSSSEEMLSSNEELQCTNEELETSKEELQSTNEELNTIKQELKNRNVELNLTNDDLVNLLSSIKIPVVMVGGDLRVRRITPLAEKILNILPTDIGRTITDITLNISMPNLREVISNVMETVVPQEFEVKDQKSHWYSFRIHPYRTIDNKIDGAVLLLVDIHQLKLSRDMAVSIVETVRESLLLLSQNLKVVSANQSFYETYQVSREDTENHLIYDLGNKQWDIPKLRSLLTEVLSKKCAFKDYKVEYEFPNIGKRTMLLNARLINIQIDKMEEMILLSIEDTTERAKAEERILAQLAEKEVLLKEIHHRVKNNLNIVSSLLDLQADSIKDENVLKVFRESQNRIRSIALIHEKLYQAKDLARINFGDYVEDLVLSVMNTFGMDIFQHTVKFDIKNVHLNVDTAIPCSLVINELVSNSLKHAFPEGKNGEIFIGLKSIAEKKFELIVWDNGVGLPKGLDFRTTKSLGLQLVIALVKQLEGEIELSFDKGTVFKIRFAELQKEV